MYSVTQRIKEYKQPYGGYLPVKNFEVINLESNEEILEGETISPIIAGIAVDYLTRFMLGASVEDAFRISLSGARRVNEEKNAEILAKKINGLDDDSIKAACKLVGYDSAFRAGKQAYKDVSLINPSEIDVKNILIMVSRSLAFFDEYGPITKDGFTFEGGYTSTISSGDGDFLTSDTLWDFKVSINKPTNKHTLQILVYYLMGTHSTHSEDFEKLKYLAIFNPRLNAIYRYPIENIPSEIIEEVSNDVIGYVSKKVLSKSTNKGNSNEKKDVYLTVKDIASRYGVSEAKVRKDCFDLGLPKTKQGNKYIIKETDLLEWEFYQVYIPIGRNGYQLLPGYLAVIKILEAELQLAKENRDKEKIKEVKRKLSSLKSKEPRKTSYAPIGIFLAVMFFIITLIVVYSIFMH